MMKKGVNYIGIAVGALIFNDKHEIFLTKRGCEARNERGCWEAPGGGVKFNETLQHAIKREIKEEYAVDIKLLKQLPAQNHILLKEKQHWVPSCFISKVKKNQSPKIMEPHKCDAIGWFSLDKLPRPLSIITKLDIKTYKKYCHGKI